VHVLVLSLWRRSWSSSGPCARELSCALLWCGVVDARFMTVVNVCGKFMKENYYGTVPRHAVDNVCLVYNQPAQLVLLLAATGPRSWHFSPLFLTFLFHLQRVRIACNAERCNSQRNSVRSSLRHIPVFCPDSHTSVRLSALSRTIILVYGEVRFIRIFAGDHLSEGVKVKHLLIASENLTNNRL